jgi:hypothetical protein
VEGAGQREAARDVRNRQSTGREPRGVMGKDCAAGSLAVRRNKPLKGRPAVLLDAGMLR